MGLERRRWVIAADVGQLLRMEELCVPKTLSGLLT
jgi:hypothetical protein